MQRLRGYKLGLTYRMRAEYLWEWLREHRVAEVAAEAKRLTSPEERVRGADEGGEEGEDQYKSKWYMLV